MKIVLVMAMTSLGARERYYVEDAMGERLHILNKKSLDWHMKRHMGIPADQRKEVFGLLTSHGICYVPARSAA